MLEEHYIDWMQWSATLQKLGISNKWVQPYEDTSHESAPKPGDALTQTRDRTINVAHSTEFCQKLNDVDSVEIFIPLETRWTSRSRRESLSVCVFWKNKRSVTSPAH